MLATMCDRGPDWAGFAVYGDEQAGSTKTALRGRDGARRWPLVAKQLAKAGAPLSPSTRSRTTPSSCRRRRRGGARVADRQRARGDGGEPGPGAWRSSRRSAARHGGGALRPGAHRSGTHAIGHTRMATESAVTTDGAHPFTTGADQCLVHNGSLSNHNAVRATLVREGLSVPDRQRHRGGGRLSDLAHARGRVAEARRWSARCADLDGFYTFVVGTETASACCAIRSPASRP